MQKTKESSSWRVASESNRVAHDTSLQSFSFEGTYEVQVVIINDEPHFVAVDVCNILGLTNPSDKLKDCLYSDEYLPYLLDRAGQQRTVNVVTESGLYALIFKSRKTVAKKFRRWVTSEVLPAIRKTGSYSVHEPYPGKMLPTNCVVLTCHTSGGQSKQAYLLYNADDMWFECPRWCPDYENVMQSMMKQIGEYDKGTVICETRGYSIKNGKYVATPFLYPKHDKRPKNDDAVKNCENAIEKYRKAKQEVKVSAEALAEYMNVKC